MVVVDRVYIGDKLQKRSQFAILSRADAVVMSFENLLFWLLYKNCFVKKYIDHIRVCVNYKYRCITIKINIRYSFVSSI